MDDRLMLKYFGTLLLVLLLPALAFADTKKIEGTTNVEDAYLHSGADADKNYGGSTVMWVHSTSIYVSLIRVKNVYEEIGAGATITGAVCSVYCDYYGGGDAVVSAYSVFKPWVEGDENGVDDDDGDVTYNDFQSDALEFGTEGCLCARDAGVDNSNDDGACTDANADRKATAEGTQTMDGEDKWYGWSISAELAQAWYDETKNEEGILLVCDNQQFHSFVTTEGASNQPFWVFTYTTEEPEAAGQVIMINK